MSGSTSSLGTKFEVETSVADTFIRVEECNTTPQMIGDKAAKIDVTNLDSNGYKEYIADLKEAVEGSFTANWLGSEGQLRLKELYDSRATVKFKKTLPDKKTPTGTGTIITRSGYVSSFDIQDGLGKQLIMAVSIQFSGEPDFQEAA